MDREINENDDNQLITEIHSFSEVWCVVFVLAEISRRQHETGIRVELDIDKIVEWNGKAEGKEELIVDLRLDWRNECWVILWFIGKGLSGEESNAGVCKRKGLVELSTHIDEELGLKFSSKRFRKDTYGFNCMNIMCLIW